jgi:hypothetical protein
MLPLCLLSDDICFVTDMWEQGLSVQQEKRRKERLAEPIAFIVSRAPCPKSEMPKKVS